MFKYEGETIYMALRGFNEPMEVYMKCQSYVWQGVTFLQVGLVVNEGRTPITIASSKVSDSIADASSFEKVLTEDDISNHQS